MTTARIREITIIVRSEAPSNAPRGYQGFSALVYVDGQNLHTTDVYRGNSSGAARRAAHRWIESHYDLAYVSITE